MMGKANGKVAVSEKQAYEALRLAQVNEYKGAMSTSAVLAAQDAAACFAKGDFYYCAARAAESLAYSVGVFNEAYLMVKAVLEGNRFALAGF